MKKILLAILAIGMGCHLLFPTYAFATEGGDGQEVGSQEQTGTSEAGSSGCLYDGFLNLPAWYYGLPGDSSGGGCAVSTPENPEELKKYIWTISLNIASIVFGVSGYLAVLFVVYGGYLYMLSAGDPAKAAQGKKTITNAVIGIVICALASTISGAINGIATEAAGDSNFFAHIMSTALWWAGVVSVVMIVVGGIYYVSSNGDPSKVTQGKNTIMYAVIGLTITIVAAAIINVVLGAL